MAEQYQTERTVVTDEPVDVGGTYDQNRKVSKAAQIVWYVVGFIVTVLLVRFLLALVGANTANAFANFVYNLSGPFVEPFRGLLKVGEFQAGISRFEFETLIAALIYILIGWGIVRAIALARK